MKPASAKAKGRRLQNAVAALVREWFGLSDLEVRPAIMGEAGIDIKLGTAARRVFPFAIECKQTETMNVWKGLEQARANAEKEGLIPVLVFSRNRQPAYAAIPLALFLELAAARAAQIEET